MTTSHLHTLASHYASPWYRGYVKSKLRTDPLYGAVFDELRDSTLPLLDIGCGLGLLAFYLRSRGFTPVILGIDYDRGKVEAAQSIADRHYPGTTFRHGDARNGIPAFEGNVTILDILQFFDHEKQAGLLAAAARCTAPGGHLVIRSGLRETGWRFRVTYAGDLLARATRWMRAAPTCYPTRSSICSVLEGAGLTGTVTPLWGKTPFNNYLISYHRPAAAQDRCPASTTSGSMPDEPPFRSAVADAAHPGSGPQCA